MSTRKRSGIPGTDPVRYIEELEAELDRLREDLVDATVQEVRKDKELARLRVYETLYKKEVEENARLREERDKLHGLYNRAQDDASREAEIRVNQGLELARLREEGSHLDQTHREQLAEAERRAQVNLEDANRGWSQRNALLAALREIDLIAFHMEYGPIRDIARAAIAEVEGETT